MRISRFTHMFQPVLFSSLLVSLFIFVLGCHSFNKPSPPSDFEASRGYFEVILSWAEVPEASYYNLYYSINEEVTKANATTISNITNPSYTHSNLSANSYY